MSNTDRGFSDIQMPKLPDNFRFAIREGEFIDGYFYLTLEQKKFWGWRRVQRQLVAIPNRIFDRMDEFPQVGENLWKLHLQKTGKTPKTFPVGVIY